LCYYFGEGVTQNYTEAVKWLSKAANQGDEDAYYYLGICYEYGQGVDKDLIVAKRHYQQAADLGHEKAKNKLKSI
jgi:TPR repeat protein